MAGWTVPGYSEIRVLGTEEAGRIVEAVHDPSGERVAITYPSAKLCSDPAFRARFRTDAELLEGLDHPSVVRVRDLVETTAEVALVHGEEVCACVILKEGAQAGADEIVEWSRERLGRHKYPRRIEFRTQFPLGPSLKVLKRELRAEIAKNDAD